MLKMLLNVVLNASYIDKQIFYWINKEMEEQVKIVYVRYIGCSLSLVCYHTH